MSRLCEIKQKEVINIRDGIRLGYVCDLDIGLECGKINEIIIVAECKLWGLLAPEKEYRIKWCNICRIGDDLIIVDVSLSDITYNC